MKALSRIAAAGLFVGLAGCGLGGTFIVPSFLDSSYVGDDFNNALAREYQIRAEDAAKNDVEWRHAGLYARKGLAAGQTDAVLPWNPSVHGLGGEYQDYYTQLIAALDNGGRIERPLPCARAQGTFDWWVEESTEIDPMSKMNEEEAKAQFMSALAECAPSVAPGPMAPTSYAIYFGWDRSDLTAEARAAINTIVGVFRDMAASGLQITGHTDTSGSPAYNQRLSDRRAASVANGIEAEGVSRSVMMLRGAGERELAVNTGDGVREPLNRRAIVDILN